MLWQHAHELTSPAWQSCGPVDTRTLPHHDQRMHSSLAPSTTHTLKQFNKEALEQQLEQQHGISYVWMGEELGGLRKRDKDSDINAGGPQG